MDEMSCLYMKGSTRKLMYRQRRWQLRGINQGSVHMHWRERLMRPKQQTARIPIRSQKIYVYIQALIPRIIIWKVHCLHIFLGLTDVLRGHVIMLIYGPRRWESLGMGRCMTQDTRDCIVQHGIPASCRVCSERDRHREQPSAWSSWRMVSRHQLIVRRSLCISHSWQENGCTYFPMVSNSGVQHSWIKYEKRDR